MTAIAAITDGKRTWIGGDSAATNNFHGSECRKDSKVFALDDFLVGCCNSFRVAQVIEYVFQPPAQKVGEDGLAYMIRQFIPELRQCLHETGACDDRATDFEGSAIVCWNGEIYTVESDFHVGRSSVGYQSIGSGYQLALGSLYSTEGSSIGNRDRLVLALTAAEAFCATVRGPFTVIESNPETSDRTVEN